MMLAQDLGDMKWRERHARERAHTNSIIYAEYYSGHQSRATPIVAIGAALELLTGSLSSRIVGRSHGFLSHSEVGRRLKFSLGS